MIDPGHYPHDDYPISDPGMSGTVYRGVTIPNGYLPEGVAFTQSDSLWEGTAEDDVYPDKPEELERCALAERDLAVSIDTAYARHAGAITHDADNAARLELHIPSGDGFGTMSMKRFVSPDGTLVDTMSFKRGKSWDSTEILLRANPGAQPRLIGAVTDQSSGEALARPPGGLYGQASTRAYAAESWSRNLKNPEATTEKPGARMRVARWIGRKVVS